MEEPADLGSWLLVLAIVIPAVTMALVLGGEGLFGPRLTRRTHTLLLKFAGQHPSLRHLTTLDPILSGTWKGVPVLVRCDPEQHPDEPALTRTTVEATCRRPLPAGFMLSEKSRDLLSRSFPHADIPVGAMDFDARLSLTAQDPEQALRMLQAHEVRSALIHCFNLESSLVVEGQVVSITRTGGLPNGTQLALLLGVATQTVEILEHAAGGGAAPIQLEQQQQSFEIQPDRRRRRVVVTNALACFLPMLPVLLWATSLWPWALIACTIGFSLCWALRLPTVALLHVSPEQLVVQRRFDRISVSFGPATVGWGEWRYRNKRRGTLLYFREGQKQIVLAVEGHGFVGPATHELPGADVHQALLLSQSEFASIVSKAAAAMRSLQWSGGTARR